MWTEFEDCIVQGDLEKAEYLKRVIELRTPPDGGWFYVDDVDDTNYITWALALGTETGAISYSADHRTLIYTEGAAPVGFQLYLRPVTGFELWLKNGGFTPSDYTNPITLDLFLLDDQNGGLAFWNDVLTLDATVQYLNGAWTEDNRLWDQLKTTVGVKLAFSDDLQAENETMTIRPEILVRRIPTVLL